MWTKWKVKSSVLQRQFTSHAFPFFHMQAVSTGQVGLQCWTVWPRPPICHGACRCASSGPPGFYVLCQPARLSLEQSVWLAILPGRCVPRPGLVFHLSTPRGCRGFWHSYTPGLRSTSALGHLPHLWLWEALQTCRHWGRDERTGLELAGLVTWERKAVFVWGRSSAH